MILQIVKVCSTAFNWIVFNFVSVKYNVFENFDIKKSLRFIIILIKINVQKIAMINKVFMTNDYFLHL